MEKRTFGRRLQKHESLNNHYRQITHKAREKWRNGQCVKLEKHERQGKIDLLYRKVSQLTTRTRKSKSLCVRDGEGNVLTDSDNLRESWKEYTEE